MSTRNRLELTWVGKDQRPRLESRILLDDPTLSYHAPARRSVADQFDNLLIHGDNLLALKALEAEFAGKVKCIFIDPPYNTGSAFTHYDDGLEHSLWLSMMRDRLEILRRLLREDGSIWITIDDRECHYLKVICDEIFGRKTMSAVSFGEKSTVQTITKFLLPQTMTMFCVMRKIHSTSCRGKSRTCQSWLPIERPTASPSAHTATGCSRRTVRTACALIDLQCISR